MNQLKVALAQIAPVWLNKAGTLAKIVAAIEEAARRDCELINSASVAVSVRWNGLKF